MNRHQRRKEFAKYRAQRKRFEAVLSRSPALQALAETMKHLPKGDDDEEAKRDDAVAALFAKEERRLVKAGVLRRAKVE